MNGLRDCFALYAIIAATFAFIVVLHLSPLFSLSQAVFGGDRLPEHVVIMSAAPIERHSPGVQNSHTLVKPVN